MTKMNYVNHFNTCDIIKDQWNSYGAYYSWHDFGIQDKKLIHKQSAKTQFIWELEMSFREKGNENFVEQKKCLQLAYMYV